MELGTVRIILQQLRPPILVVHLTALNECIAVSVSASQMTTADRQTKVKLL